MARPSAWAWATPSEGLVNVANSTSAGGDRNDDTDLRNRDTEDADYPADP